MKISVVVLTYNRKALLLRCLASILEDRVRMPDEIVIVNAGQESVEDVISKFIKNGCPIKVIKAPNISLADNRNKGVMASSCELVAFTDDDCEVCPGWVDAFVRVFDNREDIGSVGGLTIDITTQKFAHNLESISLLIEDYYNRRYSPRCYYFSTRNVCYLKKIVVDVGYFDSTYRKSFEDVLMGIKIFEAGHKNIYCPEIFVRHYGRDGALQVMRRQFQYGRDMFLITRCNVKAADGYIFKARRSIPYIILSTFAGPVRDAFRFKSARNPLAVVFFSFVLKLMVNSGILFERFRKR